MVKDEEISYSRIEVLHSAAQLEDEGCAAYVIDARTLNELSSQTLAFLRKASCIVTDTGADFPAILKKLDAIMYTGLFRADEALTTNFIVLSPDDLKAMTKKLESPE